MREQEDYSAETWQYVTATYYIVMRDCWRRVPWSLDLAIDRAQISLCLVFLGEFSRSRSLPLFIFRLWRFHLFSKSLLHLRITLNFSGYYLTMTKYQTSIGFGNNLAEHKTINHTFTVNGICLFWQLNDIWGGKTPPLRSRKTTKGMTIKFLLHEGTYKEAKNQKSFWYMWPGL